MLKEFRAFIAKGNVLDLAVAVIIGAAFAKIVDQPDRRHHHADRRQDLRRARFLELLHSCSARFRPAITASMTDYAALRRPGAPVLGWGEFVTGSSASSSSPSSSS